MQPGFLEELAVRHDNDEGLQEAAVKMGESLSPRARERLERGSAQATLRLRCSWSFQRRSPLRPLFAWPQSWSWLGWCRSYRRWATRSRT